MAKVSLRSGALHLRRTAAGVPKFCLGARNSCYGATASMRVVRETDHLYRLTRIGMVNNFLVKENDGTGTLVDTGLPGSASAILRAARQVGVPIVRILLTHAHTDHVGSLDALCNALPKTESFIGISEAPLLAGLFSAYGCRRGRRPFGFLKTRSHPKKVLEDGDMVGSLRTIFCPGHTPGHAAFLDTRDGSLIAGDSFTTQMGVVVAGVYKFYFPFPAWFSWNSSAAAESARMLTLWKPLRLAVGHGLTIQNPHGAMERATDEALRQARRTG